MTTRILVAALAAGALAATPAAAQDEPGAPPLEAELEAPAKLSKKQLAKGFKVSVTCNQACNARLTLTGKQGIITTSSIDLKAAGTKTTRLDVADLYLDGLKKGSRIQVGANVTASAGIMADDRVKITVTG